MRHLSVLFAFLGAIILLAHCGPDTLSGNTIQTGNPAMLAGVIYQSDGKKPASGAKVYVRPKVATPNTDSSTTTVTDANGAFSITTLDTGLYVVEAEMDLQKSFKDDVHIFNSDSTAKIADTLQATGSIKGIVHLSEGGDPRKVLILTSGLGRVFSPDTNGLFVMESMAAAEYDLRFLPTISNYQVLDTLNILVNPNEVTNLDTLHISYSGLPSVRSLSVTIDSLFQKVILSWNRSESENFYGYRVYRKELNEITETLMTGSKSEDTTFIDSTVLEGKYIYNVVTVDQNGNEASIRKSIEVDVKSVFQTVVSFGGDSLFRRISDVQVMPDGNLLVVDFDGQKVITLNSEGDFLSSWGKEGEGKGEFSYPIKAAVDDSGNFYILEFLGQGRIQKFDSQCNYICHWSVGTYGIALQYRDDKLYFLRMDTVFSLDPSDTAAVPQEIFSLPNSTAMCFLGNNLFAASLSPGEVNAFDSVGKAVGLRSILGVENPSGITALGDLGLIVSEGNYGTIFCLDASGQIVAKSCYTRDPQGYEIVPAERRNVYSYDSESGTFLMADETRIYRCRVSLGTDYFFLEKNN